MRVVGTIEASLVVAAQTGDRRALDDLVAASLPLVYSIVRRAMDGQADADDVVQDIMVRALRQLPMLRQVESFRSWLVTIAVHQISTHLHRRAAGERRAASLDEAAGMPDLAAEFEDVTVLEVELSAQRRQVLKAGRWLDPDHRVVLSLWLLERAGELSRTEVAAALGAGVAHAGVRIQRMREQLDLSREIVAALDARPRCDGLAAAVAEWDGVPIPLWRKRLGRHVRSCDICGRPAHDMIPVERLLPAFALLAVPVGLAAAVAGKTVVTTAALASASGATGGVGIKAGILSQFVQSIVAHPVAATIAAGALAAGTAVTVTHLPGTAAPSPTVNAAPALARPEHATTSPAPRASATNRTPATIATTRPPATAIVSLRPGQPMSLESADEPGLFVTTADDLGVLTPIQAGSALAVRRPATFTAIAGLAKPGCFSFRTENDRYLRHASWRFRLDPDQGTPLFRSDATFCVKDGAEAGSIMLEASNYPGWFLHRRGRELWVDQVQDDAAFRTASSFRVRPALAK
ncbi:sigma-70 family RNA polymerase sigma factor [Actinoplanes sp. NPDC051411]|uniref:sigma-70 family RNA polymerase sigma factor n=1 Tax=Actinoplanes sp. NPDC051411 TaxID=3155522 RepID=UPI003429B3B7